MASEVILSREAQAVILSREAQAVILSREAPEVILRRAAPKGSLSRHGSKSLGWTAILSLASLAQDDTRGSLRSLRMTRGARFARSG